MVVVVFPIPEDGLLTRFNIVHLKRPHQCTCLNAVYTKLYIIYIFRYCISYSNTLIISILVTFFAKWAKIVVIGTDVSDFWLPTCHIDGVIR